jgi:hypothetical protein
MGNRSDRDERQQANGEHEDKVSMKHGCTSSNQSKMCTARAKRAQHSTPKMQNKPPATGRSLPLAVALKRDSSLNLSWFIVDLFDI